MAETVKVEKIKKPEPTSVTIQHIGKVRQWTVPKDKVLKVHRGTGKINHPRFEKNIVLNPGCVVDVIPALAKDLIKSRDFQKYGIEK